MRLKDLFVYQRAVYLIKKIIVKINPKWEADRYYYKVFGKHIDWKNPVDLVEKTNWLQHNTDTSLWTLCADKYRLREYVEKKGYGQYMPKVYAKWNRIEDIDFDILPDSFVMKLNNGCGSIYVVKNKKEADKNRILKSLRHWMNMGYGYSGAQLHYTRIKPCIFAEELLHNDYEDVSPNSMVDFKIWCFSGKPESVLVTYNRTTHSHGTMFYDLDWNMHPEWLKRTDTNYIPIPKPSCFDEIIDICKHLSVDFPELRLDFYVVNNRPVIGEFTLTAGFNSYTHEYYRYLGSLVDLTSYKNFGN